ncbi:MAG TPA: ComEA family DNA-binding protein [Ktedonobacterales bacterium]
MKLRVWQLALASNATFSLALLGLTFARVTPLAPAWLARVAPQSGASTLQITGPGSGSATIAAYILGDVASPGVYSLPEGARIQDLVDAAGGAQPDADMTQVDLAARVADGQEVYVPRVGEIVPFMLGGKVDINVASADDLHHALGITLAIARRIIAYRATHGQFTAVSQLLLVPISRSEYDKIAPLVTV